MNGNILLLPEILEGESISNDILQNLRENIDNNIFIKTSSVECR